jgi:hypothetical protein
MKKFFLLLIVLSAAFGAFAQSGRAFNWDIAMVNQKRSTGLSADQTVHMVTGDIFNFLITSEADCFVYIIAQCSDNSVIVLCESALKKGNELRVGPVELTPPAGTETFFVVVSAAAQKKLGQAVETYQKNPNSSRNARAALNEVFALRRDVSRLDQIPEQPVYMGGAFRGGDGSVAGIRFSGANLYVKTINISH